MASLAMRMARAADIIARDARARAALWSEQIPPTLTARVSVRGNVAIIRSQVGPSYPNEIKGVRHPVFEDPERRPNRRVPWVTNQYRPFLKPAAEAKADAAAHEVGLYINDVCHDDGFVGP